MKLNAADLISQLVAEEWEDIIPVHSILVVDALRPDGSHGLHLAHDYESPPWVLLGMLKAIMVDLESRWMLKDWIDVDDED